MNKIISRWLQEDRGVGYSQDWHKFVQVPVLGTRNTIEAVSAFSGLHVVSYQDSKKGNYSSMTLYMSEVQECHRRI